MRGILDTRRIKPKGHARLNAQSRFARDAILYPFNGGSPVPIGYAVSGLRADLVGATTRFAQSYGHGCIRLTDAAGSYVSIAPNARVQTTAFTILIAFRIETFSTYNTLTESAFGSGDSGGGFQLQVQSAGTINAVKDNVAVIMASSGSDPVVRLNEINVVAAAYDNTTCFMALNGYDLTQSTSANSVLHGQYALGSKIHNTGAETTRPMDIYMFGYWPRVLSRRDLQDLTREPSQLFMPEKELWLPPSAGSLASARPQIFTMT